MSGRIQCSNSLTVWRIIDGKPGHEAQSAGLVSALGRLRAVDCHDLPALGGRVAFRHWLSRSFPEGAELPDPDLIIGAGHRTHPTLLAARRARGGQAVVLMRPSLPDCWFDFCLVPAHDRPQKRKNVIVTQGVLNGIHSAENASIECGLILVGGPSAHYRWDAEGLLDQIRQVVEVDRTVRWVLTTSRRTPESTELRLLALEEPNLEVVPLAKTATGWVAERLQECGLAWVSEDSVSMVYEALTAGARVGLLKVPSKGGHSRVARGVEALLDSQQVVRISTSVQDLRLLPTQTEPFHESDRCAKLILNSLIANSEGQGVS